MLIPTYVSRTKNEKDMTFSCIIKFSTVDLRLINELQSFTVGEVRAS